MRAHLSWIVACGAVAACGDNLEGNHPPAGSDLSITTNEDTAVMQSLGVTDADLDDTIAIAVGTNPEHGTLAIDGLQATYTPAADYHGADSFTFTATDGSATIGPFTVSITVTSVNDVPVAGADSFADDEDSDLTLTNAQLVGNDTDADGDTLTVSMVSNAANGTVAMSGGNVVFTPTANFVGNATFQYSVSDGTASAIGTVTVAVGNLNDAPLAADDTATATEDVAATISTATLLTNDTDPEQQTLSISAVANATHGTVELAGTTITFTPDADFNGDATFEYTVTDGADTDTGVVTVAVAPVNDAPVAANDVATADEDSPITFSTATLLANDTDIDSTPTVTAVANASNGTVDLVGTTITFTPNANFNGSASFEYTLSDGTLADTGTVTIAVAAINDAPVANADTATTDEDAPVDIAAGAVVANDTDADGDALAVTAVTNAQGGSVALVGTTITFTPTANFNGSGSFQYTISDGTTTASGAVSVAIAAVNDAPVAADDAVAVQVDHAIDIPFATLLANDTDIDSTLTISAVQTAVNGTVSLQAGSVRFTPDASFVGTATFEYTASDGTLTDTALVTVDVTTTAICGDGVLGAPETCDDGNQSPGDGCDAACKTEVGFACTGEPSTCTPICGDNLIKGGEVCDDGNQVDTDGCTSQCLPGVVCTAAAFSGGDHFAVDPTSGTCYVGFDDDQQTFNAAEAACEAAGGHLATITSAGEQALVHAAQNPLQNPWIGALEDGVTDDDIFDWVTDDLFGFTSFASGEPDDDVFVGGNGDCLHLLEGTGEWADTNCTLTTFVTGRICEFALEPCGDAIRQSAAGEECDDGNTTAGDGCSAQCQVEIGCGNGTTNAGEECDDDNLTDGDGCSATCQLEQGCGDSNVDAGEECDDDNLASGDGCSDTCQLEDGCGDGNLDAGEECDDNNIAGGDGCSATCQLEVGCGNGTLDAGEECDDDNTASGDGCSATCQLECGNNVIDGTEQCDDGNRTDGDGCSATCTLEKIAVFSFTGAAGNEATLGADLPTATGLGAQPVMSRGPGLMPASAQNAFSSNNWSPVATGFDANDYYSFTLTPATGFTMTLLQLFLDEQRSATGPVTFTVRSSLDGFAADLLTPAATHTAFARTTITLPAAFAALTTAVEFRIFAFGSSSTSGTWRIDNVTVLGGAKQ